MKNNIKICIITLMLRCTTYNLKESEMKILQKAFDIIHIKEEERCKNEKQKIRRIRKRTK